MWWNSIVCEGRLDFILAFKSRALKDKLKEWAKTSNGNLAMQKHFESIAKCEKIAWRQRSSGQSVETGVTTTPSFSTINKCP
ncbi:hypothetical protein H5410_043702 [Solanum commersonii]|uniref:Uncharacterized protein n=1 Tax=Solanum commersonii TaxID=4109 RepID=A0A9J5Y1I5_SOLCO|nr:hypothetical protein H5410_043702 [Solanum commersonii]